MTWVKEVGKVMDWAIEAISKGEVGERREVVGSGRAEWTSNLKERWVVRLGIYSDL